LFTTAKLSDGQLVARTGPAADDPEGALIQACAQHMSFTSPFMRLVIDRARHKSPWTAEAIVGFLYQSPAFDPAFLDLIAVGVAPSLDSDYVKAISVLVPQAENVLRNLLGLMGEPTNRHYRNDMTLMLEKSLNELLDEPAIRQMLEEDGHLYLLTLLA